MDYLPFEQPIADLELEIKQLEESGDQSPERTERLRQLRRELTEVMRQTYANLTPWQTVLVARHKNRPHTIDYLSLMFDEFVELHGGSIRLESILGKGSTFTFTLPLNHENVDVAGINPDR